jgi:hypothetical protein
MNTRSRTLLSTSQSLFLNINSFTLATKHPLKALMVLSVLPNLPVSHRAVLPPDCWVPIGLDFGALIANGTWYLCPRQCIIMLLV